MCFIANVFQDFVIFVGQLTMYIIRKKNVWIRFMSHQSDVNFVSMQFIMLLTRIC